jgi:Secretion system C-terminal sorting domain
MKALFTIICLLCWANLYAQSHQHSGWLLPCGTDAQKSEFLSEYQRNPSLFTNGQRNPNTTYLPLTLHLVGRTDSSTVVALQSVLSSFCRLNADYVTANIQFFIEFPIRYHYNDSMYSHDSVTYGGQYMLRNNVQNTINVYFVSSPAGNCGYNLPYAGIAMNNGCLGGHTFAHEMGHCLSLPHTFLGWEGGVSWNNSITPNFNAPAPRRVTYNYTNFKDTVWTDTLIIDTTETEMVARTGTTANCATAADGFCDTEADYLAYRWTCNNNNLSNVRQLDADSTPFFSHGEYIMSYADDNCQSIFSQAQQSAMQAFITTRRQSYLYNQTPNNDSINTVPTALYPTNLTTPQTNINFNWSSVPYATHYLLEIYREPYATNTMIKTVLVADTNYTYQGVLSPRPAIFPYAWRVQPINQGYTCTNFNQPTNFNTIIPAGIEQSILTTSFKIYPNPSQNSVSVNIEIESNQQTGGFIKIYSAIGQLITTQYTEITVGINMFSLPHQNLPQGVYFIEWATAQQSTVQKFIKN